MRSRNVLTEEQVREIKGKLKAGLSQQAIADMYDVSQPTISRIRNGRQWAHVEPNN
jgi:predicted transcriptional regulator